MSLLRTVTGTGKSAEFIVPHMHNSTDGSECLLRGKIASGWFWHAAVSLAGTVKLPFV